MSKRLYPTSSCIVCLSVCIKSRVESLQKFFRVEVTPWIDQMWKFNKNFQGNQKNLRDGKEICQKRKSV